jgi:hypothetical protein
MLFWLVHSPPPRPTCRSDVISPKFNALVARWEANVLSYTRRVVRQGADWPWSSRWATTCTRTTWAMSRIFVQIPLVMLNEYLQYTPWCLLSPFSHTSTLSTTSQARYQADI